MWVVGSFGTKEKKSWRQNFFLSHSIPDLCAADRPNINTMGTGKKEATRRTRQGKTGDGMGNVKVKGENFYR